MSSVVSTIGQFVGAGGGAGGTGFAGPSGASIINPVTQDQTNTAYDQNQAQLQQQNNLLGALQAQNGLTNQSQVYNQTQNVANGTGPNPAQNMLNQATGQNVANQAALMAGQRGANQNAGMIARQAAQQGAQTQQQAASQAATMQSQQQLNALGQMGGMANQMAANQIGQTNANTQANQAEQGQLLNAVQGANNANVGMQGNINQGNTSLAGQRMGQQGSAVGGLMQSLAGSSGMIAAEGGKVPSYAEGGGVSGPQSSFGQFINNVSSNGSPQIPAGAGSSPGQTDVFGTQDAIDAGKKLNASLPPSKVTGTQMAGGMDASQLATALPMVAKGGKVPALVSPGEGYLTPEKAKAAKQGKIDPLKAAEKIPGKPKVPGAKNDYANDTVPKTLESGGLVLPRSVTQAKHPAWAAHKFVMAHMAKGGLVPKLPAKKAK